MKHRQVFKNKLVEWQPVLAGDGSFDIAKDKSRFGKLLFSPCSLTNTIIKSHTVHWSQIQCSLWVLSFCGGHRHTEPSVQGQSPAEGCTEGDKFVLINIFLESCSHLKYIAFIVDVVSYLYLGSV